MKSEKAKEPSTAVATVSTAVESNHSLAPAEAGARDVVIDGVTGWAIKINASLTDGVAAFVQAGRSLIEAKLELDHGKFERLFERGVLRVNQRTAQMLMCISEHPSLSNANNYSFLPATLNPLYQLSRMDGRRLQMAIDAGKVSVVTTIQEAKALAGKRTKVAKLSTIDVVTTVASAPAVPSIENVPIDENVPGLLSALEQYLADYPARTREILRTHPYAAAKIEDNAAMVLASVQQHRAVEDARTEVDDDVEVPAEAPDETVNPNSDTNT